MPATEPSTPAAMCALAHLPGADTGQPRLHCRQSRNQPAPAERRNSRINRIANNAQTTTL
ncbi:MAG: hypothetical protein R2932_21150 [Caldilineaceae bacterium]